MYSAERFGALLLEHRPDRLNGSSLKAKRQHTCRTLRDRSEASELIVWTESIPPRDVRCDEPICDFRARCEELMQGEKTSLSLA